MDIPLDEVIHFDAIASSSTGAAADADATPTFAVYEEATDTDIGVGGNMTKRTSLTGNYRGTFTLSAANGFEVGKWYVIVGSATIGGVATKGILKHFRVVAAEATAGNPKVDVNVWTVAAITTNITGTLSGSVGSVTGAVGSVTGAVGSVTAAVTVGGFSAGAITAAAFTAGAIDAAAIATDAIGSAEFSQAAADKVWSSTTRTVSAATNITSTGGTITVSAGSISVFDFTAAAKALLETEANDALVANHLDHLLAVDYDPASKPGVATALLNELIESDAGVSRYTANALEQAPAGGGGGGTDWTAGEREQIRQAIGIAGTTAPTTGTGNLDAVKAKTDQLLFNSSSYVYAVVSSSVSTGGSTTVSTDDATNIATIRSNLLARLIEITAQPKPTYNVDGQMFDHAGYLKHLQDALERMDALLAGYSPTEEGSQGFT